MHVEQTQAKSPPIIQVLLFWPRCCRQFSGLSSYSPLMDLAPLKTRKCCAPCKNDLCQLILCFSFLFLLSFFITNILLAPSRAVTFWSAPIHALIIYSKENHRQRYLRKETLMFIYSRTEVGTAMKTLHVVLVGHEHGHDKVTLLSLFYIYYSSEPGFVL